MRVHRELATTISLEGTEVRDVIGAIVDDFMGRKFAASIKVSTGGSKLQEGWVLEAYPLQ